MLITVFPKYSKILDYQVTEYVMLTLELRTFKSFTMTDNHHKMTIQSKENYFAQYELNINNLNGQIRP